MKKTTFLFAIFIAFQSFTFAQCPGTPTAGFTCVPDAVFEQWLITFTAVTGPVDGEVSLAEAASVTGDLGIGSAAISDFTGIEAFTNISGINISYNTGITSLDLSSNTLVTFLNAEGCSSLSSLNVDGLILLTDLNLYGNAFVSIDVDTNVALETIVIRNNASLASLDLSSNINIESVNVKNDFALTTLDMRNGNNANVTFFDSRFVAGLPCIFVDDATAAAGYGWQIDGGSTFVETEIECATLSIDAANAVVFSMYPNPASNMVTVVSKSENATVEIYNITGKRILIKTLNFGDNNLNISTLSSGVYLAKFSSENKIETKKLIIK